MGKRGWEKVLDTNCTGKRKGKGKKIKKLS